MNVMLSEDLDARVQGRRRAGCQGQKLGSYELFMNTFKLKMRGAWWHRRGSLCFDCGRLIRENCKMLSPGGQQQPLTTFTTVPSSVSGFFCFVQLSIRSLSQKHRDLENE